MIFSTSALERMGGVKNNNWKNITSKKWCLEHSRPFSLGDIVVLQFFERKNIRACINQRPRKNF